MKKQFVILITLLLTISFVIVSCKAQKDISTIGKTIQAPASTTSVAPTLNLKPITLIFSSFDPPNSSWRINFFNQWFAELEKRTGGRVKIEQHWGGELASFQDSYAAVIKGTVDMAYYLPNATAGRFPMDDICYFDPYGTQCYRVGQVLFDLYNKFPEMRAAYKDTKLLWRGVFDDNSWGTMRKPIRSLADIKGLIMLGIGDSSAARAKALGMVPIPISPADVNSSLERGILDVTSLGLWELWDWEWGHSIKYISYPFAGYNGEAAVSMNLKRWNSLPSDIQKSIDEMMPWLTNSHDEWIFKKSEADIINAKNEFGIEFYEMPNDELQKWNSLDKPAIDQFVTGLKEKGLPGQELKDEFIKLITKYSAPEYKP
jgi:TRAP-type transport system periplasmic protein